MTISAVDARRRAKLLPACSFDVFDTFIVRACTTPDGVFERAYELSGLAQRIPHSAEHFVQQRMRAEARARADAKDKRGSPEVGINEIYSFFPFRLFGLDRDALNDLAVSEFRAELDLCRANPEMLQQYLAMKQAGYRTGFIADSCWSTKQLGHLLRHCSPGLTWDFLYASCDHGHGKSEKLFAKYLSEQKADPDASLHICGESSTDTRGARRHGIRPRPHPQAGDSLASRFQRETTVFELLAPGHPSRLDHGARTLRRMVAGRSAEQTPAHRLGLTVLGPVLAAFDAFVAARRAELSKPGIKVGVAFLGHDGFLPHQVWQASHADPASRIDVDRRISAIGASDNLAPLREIVGRIPAIDGRAFADMIDNVLPPEVSAFFARQPGGIAKGPDLAEALPQLMSRSETADLASRMRARLLADLSAEIPDFDSCTDLILVDLGYGASVQKSLRRLFDREGVHIRLHGASLLTFDDAFHDVARGDSASALISDLVVTPHSKRIMLRNAAVLEQLCRAPGAAARDDRRDDPNDRPIREAGAIPAAQATLVADAQAGALAFVASARELGEACRLAPFAALDSAARWSAATLGRLLLLPDEDEFAVLGDLQHDIGLGTMTQEPMPDAAPTTMAMIARGLAAAFTVKDPPLSAAGSVAAPPSLQACLSALLDAGRLSPNLLGPS